MKSTHDLIEELIDHADNEADDARESGLPPQFEAWAKVISLAMRLQERLLEDGYNG